MSCDRVVAGGERQGQMRQRINIIRVSYPHQHLRKFAINVWHKQMRMRLGAELVGGEPCPCTRFGVRQIRVKIFTMDDDEGNGFRRHGGISNECHKSLLVNDANQGTAGQCSQRPRNQALIAQIDNIGASFRADGTQAADHDADRGEIGKTTKRVDHDDATAF